MPKTVDITGQKYNMLTAIKKTGRQTENRQYYWLCKCDCGKLTEVRIGNIRSGRTKSCGCLNFVRGEDSPNYKHGRSKKTNEDYKQYQRECYDRFKYGLEPEDKKTLIEKQNNSCAICGYKFGQKEGDMHIDHCHTTNVVRGLLCNSCNTGLGHFRDSPELLNKAAEYAVQPPYTPSPADL
jgi:hypothetical protein